MVYHLWFIYSLFLLQSRRMRGIICGSIFTVWCLVYFFLIKSDFDIWFLDEIVCLNKVHVPCMSIFRYPTNPKLTTYRRFHLNMFAGGANDLAEWCETISASVFSNVTMWVCFATHYRLLKFMGNSLYHFPSLHQKAITNGQWARERGTRRSGLIICLIKRKNESDYYTVVFNVVLANFPWWPFFCCMFTFQTFATSHIWKVEHLLRSAQPTEACQWPTFHT